MSVTKDWLMSRLAEILGFSATDEIAEYLMSIEDAEEQKQYLLEMLDPSDANHMSFVEELHQKNRPDNLAEKTAPQGMTAYKKEKIDESERLGAKPKRFNRSSQQQPETKENTPPKGQKKFLPLYSKDGKVKDVVHLPGRNVCECQAQKHDLVNNCIKCGRVVCKQEGSGPCLFCGNLVCTKEEQEVLNRGSKKSDQLMRKLVSQLGQTAEQHKNTLLEYDRTSEKRTKVIDDESDYFAVDSDKWLTPEQRDKLKQREEQVRQQRHGSRLDRKITFDFAGRRVIDENDRSYDPAKDEVVKEIARKSVSVGGDNVANPNINVTRPKLVGEPVQKPRDSTLFNSTKPNWRLQDGDLQELSDGGWCLSMHQPWASYLITGIKLHEGRTWYSPHRGRLWIHAASKVPSDLEIAQVQSMYKTMNKRIDFPTNLPTSCVLGCVDVADVMAQEEYREKYPTGESASPFVFICTNPQELLVKFPMSGKHKIYKLDANIHQAAKKSAKKSLVA